MAGDFDQILSRIGSRRRVEADNHVVHDVGIVVNQFGQGAAPGFPFMAWMKTQNLYRDFARAIAGETYNTQARTAGRRGDGNDGVSDLQLATFRTNAQGLFLCASRRFCSTYYIP